MLSTSIFSVNGSVYHQSAVFSGASIQLNETALAEIGLPALTGSNAWHGLTANLAVIPWSFLGTITQTLSQIGGLIAHCIFFWGADAKDAFRLAYHRTQPDPHYQVRPSSRTMYFRWTLALTGRPWKNIRKLLGGGMPHFSSLPSSQVSIATL